MEDIYYLDALEFLSQSLEYDTKWNVEDSWRTMVGLPAMLSSVQTWVYPDGNSSVRKPFDGEQFNDIKTGDCWAWDESKQQWFHSGYTLTYNSGNNPNVIFAGPGKITINGVELEGTVSITTKDSKCECGSEAVGSSKHSNWCKKWVST